MKLVMESTGSGTPRCACGCFQAWLDEFHDWLCPHCDELPDVLSEREEA